MALTVRIASRGCVLIHRARTKRSGNTEHPKFQRPAQTRMVAAAYNLVMSGLRSQVVGFLAALLTACPALCCVRFSLDQPGQTVCGACCHAGEDSRPVRPSEPASPGTDCRCAAELLPPGEPVRVTAGELAVGLLGDLAIRSERTSVTVLLSAGRVIDPGPPLRVLNCQWRL